MKKNKDKIQHDYECEICGKPATINIQNWWHEYSIDNEGEFTEVEDWEGAGSQFLCDDCNCTL